MSNLISILCVDGFCMFVEWEFYEQIWMVWLECLDNWCNGGKLVQVVFVVVVKVIVCFELVIVCVSVGQYENVCVCFDDGNICVVEISSDDVWVCDIGLIFVIDDKGDVCGVDWGFNVWGGFEGGLYFFWQCDDQVVCKIFEIEWCVCYCIDDFVFEGGLIYVDGEGMLIIIEECLFNYNCNLYLSQVEIEWILCDYFVVESIIWLLNGFYNDEIDGYVDNFCCYVCFGEVLLVWIDDQDDLNYLCCQVVFCVLEESCDVKGCKLVVYKMLIFGLLYVIQEECDGVDIVEGSQLCDFFICLVGFYVNFLIVNGGIIVLSFDDFKDVEVRVIFQCVFFEYEVVMVLGCEIFFGGGNIYCIIQQ